LLICRCEEVTEDEVLEAIAAGCHTVTWVKRMTRAGMGLCQGRTCGRLVARLISQQTGNSLAEIQPDTRRPPVRPIPLDILEVKDP
jgi:NAD(P)H-nitrite reductase large subunit